MARDGGDDRAPPIPSTPRILSTAEGKLDQRISLQKLEIFCLVVDLGGVGRAAEHLFVAQPVVSAHLRTLQERLGAELLYRDGRRLR